LPRRVVDAEDRLRERMGQSRNRENYDVGNSF
jgi:hypothetical protein